MRHCESRFATVAFAGIVVIEDWRAWRAWMRRAVRISSHDLGAVQSGSSHLEKAVEKGDIVGPFLQGGVEQREGAIDAGGILAEALVLGIRVLYGQRMSAWSSTPPSTLSLCLPAPN